MESSPVHMVTGAFGYSGRYITRRLLDAGVRVRTLTNSPNRANPFAGQVEAFPYSFEDPARLVETLRGTSVLYNTYWIRFNHATFRQADAVTNTLSLFEAARAAGVRRVVHAGAKPRRSFYFVHPDPMPAFAARRCFGVGYGYGDKINRR